MPTHCIVPYCEGAGGHLIWELSMSVGANEGQQVKHL